MKDFDQVRHSVADRDRRFLIAGSEFEAKGSLPADLLAAYFDALSAERNVNVAVMTAADQLIEASLTSDDQVARWRELRSSDASDPLSIRDVQDVVAYLTEVATGRPTERSSGSGRGSGKTPTSSTEQSPSEADS